VDDFFMKLNGYEVVIIFGAAELGRVIEGAIGEYCNDRGKLVCFADNSFQKWSDKVISPAEAHSRFPDALWIIASDMQRRLMLEDLDKIMVDRNNIVIDLPNDINLLKASYDKSIKLTARKTLHHLDYAVTYHCNLNCTGCNLYSPLVKAPRFAEIESFTKDMERLNCLLDGNLPGLTLLGGEPLLNPQINDFLVVGRRHLPNTRIAVITNGILLAKMPECFWRACNENNIHIIVTRYPMKLDYKAMESIAKSHDVVFGYATGIEKTSWNIALSPAGTHDCNDSFVNCFMSNKCAYLENGRIYPCSPVGRIEAFNEFFCTNMCVTQNDYVNIYQVGSSGEILEFLSNPIPFCRFCNVRGRTYDTPWRTSKREIGEWVIV